VLDADFQGVREQMIVGVEKDEVLAATGIDAAVAGERRPGIGLSNYRRPCMISNHAPDVERRAVVDQQYFVVVAGLTVYGVKGLVQKFAIAGRADVARDNDRHERLAHGGVPPRRTRVQPDRHFALMRGGLFPPAEFSIARP
jgi:hypothetical protein